MGQDIKADQRIGDNIRCARKGKGLTQGELAAKLQTDGCDISRGTLAKIEAGIRHISVEELKHIKAILDMEYEDFFADL